MNNKTLFAALVSLPVAVGAPVGGSAFAAVSGQVTFSNTQADAQQFNIQTANRATTADANIASSQTIATSGPLRRSTAITLSSGVVMSLAASDDDGASATGSQIAAGTAHNGGSSSFGATTAGGGVSECPDNNCSNMNADASTMATNAGNTAGI
ncbi:hypothetical protein [Thiohalorhabdus sp.]|uniref:hypothetical protein n=1 Tax=Thiohalorhabdus sp. TaxID=3094134 RepID=UPI002FC34536